MKGSMDVGAPIHQVKDFFFLDHGSFNLLGHEREKTRRQASSGGKDAAGWIRGALGKVSLTDSTLVQELGQILIGFMKGQLGQRGCGPSWSQLRQDHPLALGPSFADSRRTGAGGEPDPCPLLIINDFINKPA
jgi:hypothetical protein